MSLQNTADDICFVFHNVKQQDSPSSSVASFDFEQAQCSYLYGFLTASSRNVISTGTQQLGESLSLAEAESAIGEWFGVFGWSNSGTRVVVADQFGYQPVYYRSVSNDSGTGTLLVGSSATAIAYMAETLGEETKLDATQVQSALGTKHAWGITMQSDHSMALGTHILLPGEKIFVNDGVWSLIESELHGYTDTDYDALLDAGAARAIKQIQVAHSLDVDQRHINLSGGRDSRMVMALLAASGLAGEFTITSMNPETWVPASSRPLLRQDLYVASAIGEQYGMDWSPAFDSEYVPLSFEESLDLWQQFRAHKNFGFKARKGLYVQKGTNIELRGAAGETFRGFNAVSSLGAHGNWENTPTSIIRDLELVVKDVYSLGLLDTEGLRLQRQNLQRLVDKFSAPTIEEFLHRRYSVFRNRSHFGHTRESMANGQLPVLPLSQPEFYKAGALLGPNKMTTDQIAFDLIERLEPSLNTLRFDDGQWGKDKLSRASSTAKWTVPDSSSRLEQFHEMDAQAVAARIEVRKAVPQKHLNRSKFDGIFRAKNESKELLQDLSALPGGDEALPTHFKAKLTKMLDKGTVPPMAVLAKLTSARDAVIGRRPNIVNIGRSAHSELAAFRNQEVIRPTGVRISKNHPEFQVPARIEGGVFKATVRPFGNIRGPLEYKFELIDEDENLVAAQEFNELNAVSFEKVDLTRHGKVRIRVTARYRLHPETFFTFYSGFKND